VASGTGYITEELFLRLVVNHIIPAVHERRNRFSLDQSVEAMLILDGATQHYCSEAHDMLKRHNISVHFLVPHSSHLTQPLDCLFFRNLKMELRRHRVQYTDLKRSSNRLLHGLFALMKCQNWILGLRTWQRAGIIFPRYASFPRLIWDLDQILTRDVAPTNVAKTEASGSKRKRTSIFYSRMKKESLRLEKKDD